MEKLHNLIATTEQKVKDIELEIQKTVNNHNSLQGYLAATKEALIAAQAIIDTVAPHSTLSSACHAITDTVNSASALVDAVEHLIDINSGKN